LISDRVFGSSFVASAPPITLALVKNADKGWPDAYPMDFGTTPIADTLPSAEEFVLKVFVEPVNGGRNSAKAVGHSHR
jgi:hypothetical protein